MLLYTDLTGKSNKGIKRAELPDKSVWAVYSLPLVYHDHTLKEKRDSLTYFM
jgi:hypothetical protein